MKVSRTPPVQPVEAPKPRPERASTDSSPPQDTVTFSSSTAFVQKARDAAAAGPDFRSDVVEEVKASLADGTFEQSVDMDAAMDALLADL
ncbi:MAG: flagellar biosynthesis anti-sigma factor FlgM [Alphaproteobacteria bacterium]|nr:flagellar biosynthesis anti-sigma factor FlgM [Alphaproteobacteria bacterium]MCB9690971.1 flagellar biosynthesis anti-sigma factor FlgM [Alphaproteobacteria bacterium]